MADGIAIGTLTSLPPDSRALAAMLTAQKPAFKSSTSKTGTSRFNDPFGTWVTSQGPPPPPAVLPPC